MHRVAYASLNCKLVRLNARCRKPTVSPLWCGPVCKKIPGGAGTNTHTTQTGSPLTQGPTPRIRSVLLTQTPRAQDTPTVTVILTDAMGSHHTNGVTTFIHESHGLAPHQWWSAQKRPPPAKPARPPPPPKAPRDCSKAVGEMNAAAADAYRPAVRPEWPTSSRRVSRRRA